MTPESVTHTHTHSHSHTHTHTHIFISSFDGRGILKLTTATDILQARCPSCRVSVKALYCTPCLSWCFIYTIN